MTAINSYLANGLTARQPVSLVQRHAADVVLEVVQPLFADGDQARAGMAAGTEAAVNAGHNAGVFAGDSGEEPGGECFQAAVQQPGAEGSRRAGIAEQLDDDAG